MMIGCVDFGRLYIMAELTVSRAPVQRADSISDSHDSLCLVQFEDLCQRFPDVLNTSIQLNTKYKRIQWKYFVLDTLPE